MGSDENGHLNRNLAHIGSALRDRIQGASALPCTPAGEPALRQHRTVLPLALPPDLCAPPAGAGALVVGVGLGERVAALLRGAGERLMAWEPSPAVLREALVRHDWSEALSSGQLLLGTGLDLAAWLASDRSLRIRDQHPLLAGSLSWVEVALHNRGAPRVVVREGGLLVREVALELGRQGRQPWVLPMDGRPPDVVRSDLVALKPDCVVSINHMTGLPSLCAGLGLPLVEWEIDPSTERLRAESLPPDTTAVATWRAQAVESYKRAGFRRVEHLPLAADTTLRTPTEPEPGAPVVFVGASLCLLAQAHARTARAMLDRYLQSRGEPEVGEVLIHALLTVQRRKLSHWGLPALLAARLPGLEAFLRRQGITTDPALLIGETVGAEWRLNAVAACAPFGAEVWGDRGWRNVESRGVTWRGPAGARAQLSRIYSRDAVHLDIARAYQRDIVTLRVFDILACGGFVLAEHSDELSQVFAPDEIETWRTLGELKAKVAHFIAHPAERREKAARGRARVLRDHRLSQRVERILALAALPA